MLWVDFDLEDGEMVLRNVERTDFRPALVILPLGGGCPAPARTTGVQLFLKVFCGSGGMPSALAAATAATKLGIDLGRESGVFRTRTGHNGDIIVSAPLLLLPFEQLPLDPPLGSLGPALNPLGSTESLSLLLQTEKGTEPVELK